MADSVQDRGLRAGVDVMKVEDDEEVEAVGGSRRKLRSVHRKHQGEQIPSKEQCASTSSTADEAARELGGAVGAVKKKKGKCAGTFSSAEEATGKLGGEVIKKKKAASRPEARTEFRGVYRTRSGKYAAQIRRSKGIVPFVRWLGTFHTAEEAARAYDSAAVKLDGARAVTNFKASGESSGQATAGSVKMKVKKPAAVRPDARTEFRGVHRQLSGKYAARIWDSKGKCALSLGSFDTAEEAARAYDAAAVKQHGAAATTNFGRSSMNVLDDFPELPALEFSESLIPGPQMNDLQVAVPPADWQLVHEFLKDFSDVVPSD